MGCTVNVVVAETYFEVEDHDPETSSSMFVPEETEWLPSRPAPPPRP